MKLFCTGFLQVFFVAINTYLIGKEFYLGIAMVGFLISFIWSWNIKKIAFGTIKDRLLYSSGAGIGASAGVYITVFLYNIF